MIHSIDTDGTIVCCNKKGYKLLGYSSEELIGKHLKDIYKFEGWEDVEAGMKKIMYEGSLIIDTGKAIKKNKHEMDVVVYIMGLYDNNREFLGARLTVRDVSERTKLENELKERVKELEEFYDMAIGRELKMSELKEEIEALREKLKEDMI